MRYLQKIVNNNIKLGAQNISEHASGAYTGEVSADMLNEMSASYVIIGHSERRSIFGETDKQVAQKVKFALAKRFNTYLMYR